MASAMGQKIIEHRNADVKTLSCPEAKGSYRAAFSVLSLELVDSL